MCQFTSKMWREKKTTTEGKIYSTFDQEKNNNTQTHIVNTIPNKAKRKCSPNEKEHLSQFDNHIGNSETYKQINTFEYKFVHFVLYTQCYQYMGLK